MDASPGPLAAIGHRWRFAVVLLASVLLTVAQPLTSGLFGDRGSFDVFFSLLIAAVLLMVFEHRERRRIATWLAGAAFLSVWASHLPGGSAVRILVVAAYLLAASFFSFALYGIVRAVFVKQASGGAIFGAVCGYLLLGIIWSLLYSALEAVSPGAFRMPAPADAEVLLPRPDRGALGYFSFVTLATVGYGDITPVTPLARTLAWLEAISGQFYLAILLAGLVGFKVTQAMKD